MPKYGKDITILVQEALIERGFSLGRWGADGHWGSTTQDAYDKYIDSKIVQSELPLGDNIWPKDNVAALTKFYGLPGVKGGREADLVWFTFPYRMRLYDTDRVLTRHRCHRKVKDSLEGVLEAARDRLGLEFLQENHLDEYFGCYNSRRMRGGSNISRHSWGIAIDLAANQNAFKTPWAEDKIGDPGYATMPVEFIEIFEEAGWKSGARAWSRDSMHFQSTS